MYYGVDPLENEVDHENGNKSDNTIKNLRLATHANNTKNRKLSKNNTSGKSGVVWVEKNKNWTPYWESNIRINGRRIYLGCFTNKEDAIKAREEAEIKYFGEFRRKE